MNKIFSTLAISIMVSTGARAQFYFPKTIVPNDQMPQAQNYLPDFYKPGDLGFIGDSIQYEIGKSIRDTERGELAVADASTSLSYFMTRFGLAMGVPDMNPKDYPAVAELINVTMNQARNSIQSTKDHFKRERPYSYFGQQSAVPQAELENDLTSYPSGHAVRAWAIALSLIGVDTEHQDAILKVGYDLGQSRVIVGFHYQSDVEAARLCASAAFARLCTEPEWIELFNAAKAEFQSIVLSLE